VIPPLAANAPVTPSVPVIEVLSCSWIDEEPELRMISPVVPPPRVRVCMLVVARFPVPVR
jgi:hypothetical protein